MYTHTYICHICTFILSFDDDADVELFLHVISEMDDSPLVIHIMPILRVDFSKSNKVYTIIYRQRKDVESASTFHLDLRGPSVI